MSRDLCLCLSSFKAAVKRGTLCIKDVNPFSLGERLLFQVDEDGGE